MLSSEIKRKMLVCEFYFADYLDYFGIVIPEHYISILY